MQGWIPAAALQPMVRLFFFFFFPDLPLYSLHSCLKILENGEKNSGDGSQLLRKLGAYESLTGKAQMRREYSVKEDSVRDDSSRGVGVQTEELRRVTVRREEVKGEESNMGERG